MLQHALRTGLRRHPRPSPYVFRMLNTSTQPDSSVQRAPGIDRNAIGTPNDSIQFVLRKQTGGGSSCVGYYSDEFLASRETRPSLDPPTPVEPPCLPPTKVACGNSAVSRFLHRPSRPMRIGRKIALPVSTTVDIDSLAPHEMAASSREEDTILSWVAEGEIQDALMTALPIPLRRAYDSLPNPGTPEELELRLHQALTFSPLPSLSRLVKFHDLYPLLQSAASYNFLVQLAMRHTSYTRALHLLRRMEEIGIKPDAYSKLLYVRSLVRTGPWDRAWLYVRQELACGNEKAALPLLLELLGFCNPREFRNIGVPKGQNAAETMTERSGDDSLPRSWQEDILAVIPNYLPSDTHPPVHFVLTVVHHLLRNSRTETARAVTLEWISHLPKVLSLPRKRHCLRLLHMHLALSRENFTSHFSNRDFVNTFLQRRPDLRPNSSTLFLLLRSLTRAKGRPTFHALQLVNGFREKWGTGVIDRRVRRRIVHIAVREGRLNVARTWMEAEDRASMSREQITLQRAVVGEQAIKLPQKIRRMPFQTLMPNVQDENRKWRWIKRQFWRRSQLQLSRQTKPCPMDPAR